MVLLGRIELPTSPLPRVRSTTELQQQDHRPPRTGGGGQARAIVGTRPKVKHGLSGRQINGMESAMTDKPSREERLAAKLRENLRRRKAQARALNTGERSPALPNGDSTG